MKVKSKKELNMTNDSKIRNLLNVKKQQKTSGITLIALVVTIVVLLILAGITISLVFSENGIIAKAREATEKTNQAVINEQAQMNELAEYMGNMLNGISGGSTPEEPTLPSDGTYSETKGVNTPNLGEGMTPIKWDSNTNDWVETTGNDPDWYDYLSKEWANAKVEVDGVESYFVWIPRYAYRITSGYHTSTAGTIEVEFLKGTSNEIGDSEAAKSITITNASGQGDWNVHPAFVGDANLGGGYENNNGENDNGISGLWVAKFEASPVGATTDVANSQYNGTDKKLQVVPGVSSWRNITISNIYDVCKSYNPGLNSHLMKNSEWGAVAYLSKSEYGKETEEVWINNSSSFITGSAGNSASAATDTGTTNDYTSTQGVRASTTGNVYGVYDMSGGAWEYVAGYVNNGNGSLTSYGSSLVSGDAKTKNVYASGSGDTREINYNANAGIYGDAVYETSNGYESSNQSWYGDCSYFPYTSLPFFRRGGYYNDGSGAGVFAYNNGSNGYFSFRPVLVIM